MQARGRADGRRTPGCPARASWQTRASTRRRDRVTAMILYLDCASGISGDMLVGALLSLAGAREADPGPLDDVAAPGAGRGRHRPAAGRRSRTCAAAPSRRSRFKVADQPGFATFDELILSLYASDLGAAGHRRRRLDRRAHGRGRGRGARPRRRRRASARAERRRHRRGPHLRGDAAHEARAGADRRLAAGAGRRQDRDGARPAERAGAGRALAALRLAHGRRRARRAGGRDPAAQLGELDHAHRRGPAGPLRRRPSAAFPPAVSSASGTAPAAARCPAGRTCCAPSWWTRRRCRASPPPGRRSATAAGGGRSRPRRSRRARGQHRRHDARTAGARRGRAARGRRARRVDEPGAHEEGPARRGAARARRRGRPRAAGRHDLRRDHQLWAARASRAVGCTPTTAAGASWSAATKSVSA